jgi:hypothetical protein
MHQVPVKRQEDIGLSPYELKFRGRHRSQDVKITLFDISNNDVLETTIHSVDEIQSYKDFIGCDGAGFTPTDRRVRQWSFHVHKNDAVW